MASTTASTSNPSTDSTMGGFGNIGIDGKPHEDKFERVFETLEDVKGDGSSCSVLRENLKHCMKQTDCVNVQRRTPKECLQSNDPSVPEQCHLLVYSFFECKRSILDMRTRFRGRKGYFN